MNRSFPLDGANTYVLRRDSGDGGADAAASSYTPTSSTQTQPRLEVEKKSLSFECSDCKRQFSEKRALYNHRIDAHNARPDFTQKELKQWRQIGQISVVPGDYSSREDFVAAMKTRSLQKTDLLQSLRQRYGLHSWTERRLLRSIESSLKRKAGEAASSSTHTPQGAGTRSSVSDKRMQSPDVCATTSSAGTASKSGPKRRRLEDSESLEEGGVVTRCDVCGIDFASTGAWRVHLKALKPRFG